MDSEYIILAVALTLVGLSGIILFNGPKTPSQDSCYCIIPSPEAGAMQGTSGILLIFGVMFIPIGILKGGIPGRRVGPPTSVTVKSGRVYSPIWFSSGPLFALGLVLAFIGIDFVIVPSILVIANPGILAGGVVLTAFGVYLAYMGTKIKKAKQQ